MLPARVGPPSSVAIPLGLQLMPLRQPAGGYSTACAGPSFSATGVATIADDAGGHIAICS